MRPIDKRGGRADRLLPSGAVALILLLAAAWGCFRLPAPGEPGRV